MKVFYLTAFAALLTLTVSAQKSQSKKIDTVFFDDFNAKTLDRTKWNVEVSGTTNNDEQQAYVDSASTLYFLKNARSVGAKNGALVIKAVYHKGYTSKEKKTYDFLSARINSENKMQFTYGTLTARMKIAAGAGLWPAIWALGNGKWLDCGKKDFMETFCDKCWTSNARRGPGGGGGAPRAGGAGGPGAAGGARGHT